MPASAYVIRFRHFVLLLLLLLLMMMMITHAKKITFYSKLDIGGPSSPRFKIWLLANNDIQKAPAFTRM
jgi:hypothetical protein